jgi:hypothetical protein
MAFFAGLFGKPKVSASEDKMRRIMALFEDAEKEHLKEIHERRAAAAAHGMLPSPDIVVDYHCECGEPNTFHMKKLNLNYGSNVQCLKCGAVLHVSATVLDHKKYWPAGEGASLVQHWRDQMRFIRHRRW